MQILGNPLAQFIITASIGLLAVLSAIFIPIFIYRRQKNRKEITWRIISNTLVLPIQNVGEQIKSKLQISYDGKSVNDLRLAVLKISNTGDIPIEANDFENNNPISFYFGKEAEILNVEILDTTPASFKSRAESAFKVSQGQVNLEPLLLNSKDTISFKVLLIKFSGQINVSGRISGVNEILGGDSSLQLARRLRIRLAFLALALILVAGISWILSILGLIAGNWIGIMSAVLTIAAVSLVFSQWLFPFTPVDAEATNRGQ